jgi:precorrin-3B methylase
VTDAGREGQRCVVTTVADLDVTLVGMTSVVIIGSSTTTLVNGRMLTPRGYR